ncbi:PP2C family protein-serine/threonine phosphatase [Leptospira sp. GIMC2001]|uniref:PP2C family protein-serine/threonine phosphatase n=1 Tax=Leptospira sp. GIMC2001 TaxID=1513297 RepID=UPI00234B6BE2|nr:PP2C family protein-serine/threonine phosphatase [Leptospira sp. GIMC2001]WCL47757.1 PP2C family protein-serine/threonine phosphatase [Leptospira sp. GIMC2001]
MLHYFRKIWRIQNRIVYGDISLQETNLRFLLTVYFYGGFCGAAATLFNIVLDLNIYLTLVTAFMAVLFFGFHRSLFKSWLSYNFGVRLFYYISASYFNLLWFLNAGIDGGNIIFFYLLVVVIMIFSEGRERIFHLVVISINVVVLFLVDYHYPNLSLDYPSRLDRYVDVLVSVVIALFVNYIAISVVLNALKRNRIDSEKKYKLLSQDLNLAKKIQKTILPSRNLISELFKVTTHYQPMTEIGGDVYSVDELSSTKLRFFIADATGHGVQAALVTMLILSEYLNRKTEYSDPAKLLTSLNRAFLNNYQDLHAIFSCVVLDWDFKRRKIYYASAGHIPQIIMDETGVKFLEKTGPIIGLKPNAEYRRNKIRLNGDSKLLLFTDGLTEAFDEQKNMYGEERIVSFFDQSDSNLDSAKLMNKVLDDLKIFLRNSYIQDDLTIVAATSIG